MIVSRKTNSAFTLIELLVVIGIIAVLALVVIFVVQPLELLRRSRDSNRLSDLATLQTALSLYSTDVASGSMGSSSVVYVSIPDPAATSTLGDQCQGLGLPSLSASSTYHCAASSTYRNVDGTGWIPVNFKSISSGSPFGTLPLDPASVTSTNLYYAYTTNGATYEVTSLMESQKYRATNQNAKVQFLAQYPGVVAVGNNLALSPLWSTSNLFGYWTLDEGSGSSTLDSSGSGQNGLTGTWQGTPSGQSGTYYASGKVGNYEGILNGTDNDVAMSSTSSLQQAFTAVTLMGWEQINSAGAGDQDVFGQTGLNYAIGYNGAGNIFSYYINSGSNHYNVGNGSSYLGSWHHYALVFNGSTIFAYIDGQLKNSGASSFSDTGSTFTGIFQIGYSTISGAADDVRFYSRALSAAEVLAVYNSEK